MSAAVAELVRETVEVTGARRPALLEDDAPVPGEEVLTDGDDDSSFYLVGLIGGKDVGKSALINALVGSPITQTSSHGPGTEQVVAYAHASQEPALRDLLQRRVPGQHRIVTHDNAALRRQVLLDLPDIDSHWQSHVRLTRTMLRHMLFPIWVQSVEKYADLQPQEMLAQVAEGNSPQNFIFCLSKADQLERAGAATGRGRGAEPSPEAVGLRDDYGARLARVLGLPTPPAVYLLSSFEPERFDLPRLRELLSRGKATTALRESKQLATRRRERSLLSWLGLQDLPARAERLGRLRREAEELVSSRVGVPLLERTLLRLLEDPSNRSALSDQILNERVALWPLVNLVHTLLAPLFALVRGIGARQAPGLQDAEAMVELILNGSGRAVAGAVQAAFAQLRQSQPDATQLYAHRRLWEDLPSDLAAAELTRALGSTINLQREAARERLAGQGGMVAPFFRWLLTIGALLWFPIVQPVLAAFLNQPIERSPRALAGLIVSVLGVDYLLKSAAFLAIYFVVIWLALRWNTQRRVARLLSHWKSADDADPALSVSTQALHWMGRLTDPVRLAHERAADLARRFEDLQKNA